MARVGRRYNSQKNNQNNLNRLLPDIKNQTNLNYEKVCLILYIALFYLVCPSYARRPTTSARLCGNKSLGAGLCPAASCYLIINCKKAPYA
jgi:hypothetical protein